MSQSPSGTGTAAATGTGGSNIVGNTSGGTTNLPSFGLSPYGYQQTAPLTANQQTAMNNIAGLTTPMTASMMPGMNTNVNFSTGSLMSPYSNPYTPAVFDVAAQNATQQYQQATAPNIVQQGFNTGTLGSSGMAQNFQDAQAGLGEVLGNIAAGVFNNAYNTGLGATQTAIGQQPGLVNAMYTPSNNLMAVGNQQQQQAQSILNNATTNANAQAGWPQQVGSWLSNLIGQGGTQGTSVAKFPSTASGK